MTTAWLSTVPYNIARDILEHPDESPVGRELRYKAVALFADVSGFTAISEALGQAGRAGTEELTGILNRYFETMIALIHSYGGMVGQFGGDAVTVMFPYTSRNRQPMVRRAIQCALDMQANMDRYAALDTRAGTFVLSMKAGLAAGGFFCTTVGDPAVGYKFIIAGEPLDLCAEAEHRADQGEVVIHDDLLPYTGQIEIAEERDGFSAVERLRRRASPRPQEEIARPLSEAARATFAAYLPPVVAGRFSRGQSGFINEHRRVTVLFISFSGFDYDTDEAVGDKLRTYFAAVLQIVARYGGYLNKIDMGDKGSKYIVLFGAPVAHEDDEERALRCALELRALAGVTTRIGVNTGFVFGGLVGAEARQEYTVMGDAVNLSARLMQAAQTGQILASRSTQSSQADNFAWQKLEPLRVKGKSQPIEVFTVEQTRGRAILQTQELDYGLPMVGRETELTFVEERLAAVMAGQGQVVGITAEAGMGKTRLAAEIVRLASARGLARHGGECQSYGTTTSYLVWRHIWQTFFVLDASWPLERQIAHLEAQLAVVDPVFVQRLPLLGPLLNLPIPDNELTATLDANLRKASLESLLVACVRDRAQATPLILVLEDCHWIDPLSYDLLEVLARNIVDVPVLILVLYRPPELAHIDLDRIRRMPHFHERALTEFTRDEAELLIELKLRQVVGTSAEPSPALVTLLTAKAQGNPFYIDEMINLLQDQGIDPQNVAAVEALDLPDSLHNLIVSRIDRLVEDAKIALKVASVIGRMFRADWLWHVYPRLGQPDRVRDQLEALSQLDFVTPAGAVDPELEYLFKHIVTQEVAYEGLAVATRERLHAAIGAFIERTYPGDLDRFLDLLAFHYGHSRDEAKQREYFLRAGDAARRAYANDAALDYYRRLLPLLPEDERPPVLLKLGKVWELTGKWDEAEDAYRRALAQAERMGDEHLQAQCLNELGRLHYYQGSYAEAVDLLEDARARLDRLGDPSGSGKVLINLGNLYLVQGDPDRALGFFEQALHIARAADDRELASQVMGNLGIVYGMKGDPAGALPYFEQQVQLKTALGDRLGASIATGNLGVAHEALGDYAHALTCYQQQLVVSMEAGAQRYVSMAVGNMGLLYSRQGDHDAALRCFAQQLEIALELGNRRVMGFALVDIAATYQAQNRHLEAGRLFAQATALARDLNTRYDLCYCLHRQAAHLAEQGQYAQAAPLTREALDIAGQVQHREVAFEAGLLAIQVRVALAEIDAAGAVTGLEVLLKEAAGDDQRAALFYEIWRLRPTDDVRQEAAGLYARLYNQTPNAIYRDRYRELTGETLAEAPPLPALPEAITRRAVDLGALLARAAAQIPGYE